MTTGTLLHTLSDQQITDTITWALEKMREPGGPDAIAAASIEAGLTGTCKSAEHCLIAEVLRTLLGPNCPDSLEVMPHDDARFAEVTWDSVDYDPDDPAAPLDHPTCAVTLPAELNEVAVRFDAGEWPALIAPGPAAVTGEGSA